MILKLFFKARWQKIISVQLIKRNGFLLWLNILYFKIGKLHSITFSLLWSKQQNYRVIKLVMICLFYLSSFIFHAWRVMHMRISRPLSCEIRSCYSIQRRGSPYCIRGSNLLRFWPVHYKKWKKIRLVANK